MVLQSFKLPDCSTEVLVTASGQGSALVQLVAVYNVPSLNAPVEPSFVIEQKSVGDGVDNNKKIDVQTCVRYEGETETGMVLIEATLLSGYEINKMKLDKLVNKVEGLMLVELKNKDTVVFYFDPFKFDQFVCVYWTMFWTHDVTDLKAVPVKVYDFYNSKLQASTLFSAPKMNVGRPLEKTVKLSGINQDLFYDF